MSDIHKRVYQYGLVRQPEETLSEHMNIVNAVLSRDFEAADRALRNHIGLSRKKLYSEE